MLVDTDVVIWNFRGNLQAASVLDHAIAPSISSVTYMELLQGMRNAGELRALRQAMHVWGANVLHVSPAISARACFLMEESFLSHSLKLADALLAATAIEHGELLLTGNARHYRGVEGLEIELFSP